MANEPTKPVISTTEMVMKICLIVSIVVGTLLVVLALVGNRNVLNEGGFIVTMVALQWFFYVWVRARRRKDKAELNDNPS
jgi:hypothetical protein